MVCHNINHKIHASSVQCLRECQEVIRRAMVWIDIVSSEIGERESRTNPLMTMILHILLPVPMIGRAIASVLRKLFCHWSDPNGSKAHSLDIIQLVVKSVYGV